MTVVAASATQADVLAKTAYFIGSVDGQQVIGALRRLRQPGGDASRRRGALAGHRRVRVRVTAVGPSALPQHLGR